MTNGKLEKSIAGRIEECAWNAAAAENDVLAMDTDALAREIITMVREHDALENGK